MNEAPRRRRSTEEPPSGGGLPLFPLVLVVIFAGLLLGGALAHVFGGSRARSVAQASPQSSATAAALPATPFPQPSPRPTAALSPKPTPRATHSPAVRASHSPSPAPSPTLAATPSAKPSAAVARATAGPVVPARAVVYVTPPPHRAAPASTPAAAATLASATTPAPNYQPSGSDQAASVVRSYLGALARGDKSTATSYLMHGLPNEPFMDSSARILSIDSKSTAAQQYKVTADVATSSGEYYITFTVEPGAGGLQIGDHFAIKVQ